jgi:hypothetical protein
MDIEPPNPETRTHEDEMMSYAQEAAASAQPLATLIGLEMQANIFRGFGLDFDTKQRTTDYQSEVEIVAVDSELGAVVSTSSRPIANPNGFFGAKDSLARCAIECLYKCISMRNALVRNRPTVAEELYVRDPARFEVQREEGRERLVRAAAALRDRDCVVPIASDEREMLAIHLEVAAEGSLSEDQLSYIESFKERGRIKTVEKGEVGVREVFPFSQCCTDANRLNIEPLWESTIRAWDRANVAYYTARTEENISTLKSLAIKIFLLAAETADERFYRLFEEMSGHPVSAVRRSSAPLIWGGTRPARLLVSMLFRPIEPGERPYDYSVWRGLGSYPPEILKMVIRERLVFGTQEGEGRLTSVNPDELFQSEK